MRFSRTVVRRPVGADAWLRLTRGHGLEGTVSRRVSVVVHAIIGWAICGATIGVGRQIMSMDATLAVHAVVAPLAFGLLTWHHFVRYPTSSPLPTSLAMLGVVVLLDALVVAPFLERSYVMFRLFTGTWLPFGLIWASSYLVARQLRRSHPTPEAKAV